MKKGSANGSTLNYRLESELTARGNSQNMLSSVHRFLKKFLLLYEGDDSLVVEFSRGNCEN